MKFPRWLKPTRRVAVPKRVEPTMPFASNTIIEDYGDGHFTIQMASPTPEVLEEYERAIRDDPEDATIRRFYSQALSASGDREAAKQQLLEAMRLQPADAQTRSALGHFYQAEGDLAGAVGELEEALRLIGSANDSNLRQLATIVHWGLSETLRKMGRATEARVELRKAISLADAGPSNDLRRCLKIEWARYHGFWRWPR